MPTESDHIALANKNHDAMMCLHQADGEHPEWLVSIAFYKAVHIVTAISSKQKHKCHDHTSRHDWLKVHFPAIWKHYRPLWQASLIARYLYSADEGAYQSFADYCPVDRVYTRFINKRLKPIEDLSVSQLSDATKLQRVPDA